MDVISHTGNMS